MGHRKLDLLCAAVAVASAAGALPAAAEPEASEPARKFSLQAGLASFLPNQDEKLTSRRGDLSYGFTFGYRYSRHLAAELEYLDYSQKVDAPDALVARCATFFCKQDRSGSVDTSGFGGLLKLLQPVGPVDAFIGGGIGFYNSKLSVSAFDLLTFQRSEVSRGDRSRGKQWVGGLDIHTSDASVWSIQYRKLVIDADFGPGIGSTTVGGRMWQLSYRYTF